jgi:hypothetical protein
MDDRIGLPTPVSRGLVRRITGGGRGGERAGAKAHLPVIDFISMNSAISKGQDRPSPLLSFHFFF